VDGGADDTSGPIGVDLHPAFQKVYFTMGARSQKLLAGLKDWMSAHNAVIMAVLCLIIAAKLIGDRISGLAG
jgi:hypothetical protein